MHSAGIAHELASVMAFYTVRVEVLDVAKVEEVSEKKKALAFDAIQTQIEKDKDKEKAWEALSEFFNENKGGGPKAFVALIEGFIKKHGDVEIE